MIKNFPVLSIKEKTKDLFQVIQKSLIDLEYKVQISFTEFEDILLLDISDDFHFLKFALEDNLDFIEISYTGQDINPLIAGNIELDGKFTCFIEKLYLENNQWVYHELKNNTNSAPNHFVFNEEILINSLLKKLFKKH
jgi:hypothetical protein